RRGARGALRQLLRWGGSVARLLGRVAWRLVKSAGRLLAKLPRAAKRLLPSRATRRRAYRGFARWPWSARIAACLAFVVVAWAPINWLYQVVRKPSELLFPVSGALYKTPSATWATYAPLFRRHSTEV